MTRVPEAAKELLGAGTLCYLAAVSGGGLHLTPVVFVFDGGKLWATTSRGSVKARLWERDERAAGLVGVAGAGAVAFRGPVRRYDALDPTTWPRALVRAPALAKASARFTAKNLRYFAGYARDARRVPFGWTPPGRILFSVEPAHGAVLDPVGEAVVERWGSLGARVVARRGFRAASGRPPPDERIPEDVRALIAAPSEGVLALLGRRGPIVLPVRWARAGEEGVYYAVLPRSFAALAGVDASEGSVPAALVIDRASRWRAAEMTGLLLRGRADVYDPSRVRSGARSLRERIALTGAPADDPIAVRLRPARAVWWRGWASGTVWRS